MLVAHRQIFEFRERLAMSASAKMTALHFRRAAAIALPPD